VLDLTFLLVLAITQLGMEALDFRAFISRAFFEGSLFLPMV
jgi:hypothetical protein